MLRLLVSYKNRSIPASIPTSIPTTLTYQPVDTFTSLGCSDTPWAQSLPLGIAHPPRCKGVTPWRSAKLGSAKRSSNKRMAWRPRWVSNSGSAVTWGEDKWFKQWLVYAHNLYNYMVCRNCQELIEIDTWHWLLKNGNSKHGLYYGSASTHSTPGEHPIKALTSLCWDSWLWVSPPMKFQGLQNHQLINKFKPCALIRVMLFRYPRKLHAHICTLYVYLYTYIYI